eukprot:6126199-Pleurochrysis_carterae.AAC.1
MPCASPIAGTNLASSARFSARTAAARGRRSRTLRSASLRKARAAGTRCGATAPRHRRAVNACAL